MVKGLWLMANVDEAVEYFRLSAKGKNSKGQILEGICSYSGIGCPVDRTEAAELVRVAADQRDARGHFKYGVLVAECARSQDHLKKRSKYL
jgi:TPR repeat protein